jgi:hypothetical protein
MQPGGRTLLHVTISGHSPCCLALQLEKVFLIWQRKAIINDALLQPALLQARTRRAQHDSAWGDADLSVHTISTGLGASRAAAGGIPGLRDAAGGQQAAVSKKPVAMSGPEGEAWLWRQWRRCPMNTVTIFKFIDQKVGGKRRVGNPFSGCVWGGLRLPA